MKKKILSFLLAGIMLINTCSPSFAAEAEPEKETTQVFEYGDFSMEPRNPDMGKRPAQNLVGSDPGEHAYNQQELIAEEPAAAPADFVPHELLYARTQDNASEYSVMSESDPLRELGIISSEPVYTTAPGEIRKLGGKETVWYKASITGDVLDTVEAVKNVSGVVAAEPNYLYTTEAVGQPSQVELDRSWIFDSGNQDLIGVLPAWETLASSQKAPGAGTVVAVIDTGVDYTHEDLKASMWHNPGEVPGDGIDNDGNGYIDDVYGINATANPQYDGAKAGDPMDDHGHGTHVAGIIGMTAGNGDIGGVGIAYGAKILAVKAGQSTGTFTSADIAEAIEYAARYADVINMSFGGSGRSTLVETALQDAFGKCVLVAAAGNNGLPTTDAPDIYPKKVDIYPAGYNYVLGVMASDDFGQLASFSNWDYISNANCEYEMTAPGMDIYSTLPGNRYAKWSGTSMAAPCVSAAAAILRSQFADRAEYSCRFLYGQLCSAPQKLTVYPDRLRIIHKYSALNMQDSLTRLPKPNLKVSQIFALDLPAASVQNDGDSIVDAGETVDLGIGLRNRWGKTGTITVKADAISDGGVANPYVTFVTDTITLDPAGTFARSDNGFTWKDGYLESVSNPIRFTLAPDTPNDTEICINLTMTTTNGLDPEDTAVYATASSFTFRVQNGMGIRGTLKEDTVLDSSHYWIIENGLFVPEGRTLTVEPGTQIQFYSSDFEDAYGQLTIANLINKGTLNMIGTENQPIRLFPGTGFEYYVVEIAGEGIETLKYCDIINPRLGEYGLANYAQLELCDHCNMVQNSDLNEKDEANLYYRYVYEGVVNEKSLTEMDQFLISNLINSSISGFRAFFPSTHRIFDCFNVNCVQFINCSIMQSPYSKQNLSMNNTVFLGGHGIRNAVGSSPINTHHWYTAKEDPPTFRDVLSRTDAEGNVLGKYVFMNPYPESYERQLASDLATSLSGTLVSFNSAEEETFIAEYMKALAKAKLDQSGASTGHSDAYIGYTYDEEKGIWIWADGSRDYLPDYAVYNSTSCPFAYSQVQASKSGSYSIYRYNRSISNDADFYYILEFPSSLTDEEINAHLSCFDYDGWLINHNPSTVANNAILNPVLDLNPEGWTRFSAPEYQTGRYAPLMGNYWGTENSMLIDKMIVDGDDSPGVLMDIREDPILTLQDDLSSIYPFVTEIRLEDTDGNILDMNNAAVPGQTCTVHVCYNRDMDQSVNPMVSYGPADPWTDFLVDGAWTSAREWVGQVKISSVATDGAQYWRTKGGRTADDHWLVCGTDNLRFGFTVKNNDALAMVLQAVGSTDRVDLSWFQTDYDTLAGYNFYRSTEPDSGFVKLNDTLITGSTYSDTQVEPGVTYYYYYKVVDTEGNELEGKSNVASAAPKDNILPSLTHTPVTASKAGQTVTLSASASDNIAVASVTAYYRTAGTERYTKLPMEYLSATQRYVGVIPAEAVTEAGVEYYIAVRDSDGNLRLFASAQEPQAISVDASPTLTGIAPAIVSPAGGQAVTVYGHNLTENMIVTLCGSNGERIEISHYEPHAEGFSFTAPALSVGVYDLAVADRTHSEKSATLLRCLSCVDAQSSALLGSGKISGEKTVEIPLYLSASGQVNGFHAEVNLPSTHLPYGSVRVVPAEGVNASLDYNYDSYSGLLTIAMTSAADFNPGDGKAVCKLQLTPNTVSEETALELMLRSVTVNDAPVGSCQNGSLTIYPKFNLMAQIHYFLHGKAVDQVTVTAGGLSAVSGSDGSAQLSDLPTPEITVSLNRQDTEVPEAINAYDASLILKHCVGTDPLTENMALAADVNGDGKITEMDASLILQKAVRKLTGAYPGSGKTWIFPNTPRSLTLTQTDTTEAFTAIMLGDVDGSWGKEAPVSQLSSTDSAVLPSAFLLNMEGKAEVRLAASQSVTAVDLVFDLTKPNVQPQFLVESLLPAANKVDYHFDQAAGKLYISIASAEPIDLSGALVQISDTTQKKIAAASMLKLSSLKLNGEAAAWTEIPTDVCLVYQTNTYYSTIQQAVANSQKGQTIILLQDHTEEDVMLKNGVTLDLNGKKLTAKYFVAFNGNNVVDNVREKGILNAVNMILSEDNAHMAVYTGSGYVFGKMYMQQAKIIERNPGQFTLAFRPIFESTAMMKELCQNGSADNRMQIGLRASWMSGGSTITQDFLYSDEMIAGIYSKGTMFSATLFGFPEGADVTIQSIVKSDSHQTVSKGAAQTVTVTQH